MSGLPEISTCHYFIVMRYSFLILLWRKLWRLKYFCCLFVSCSIVRFASHRLMFCSIVKIKVQKKFQAKKKAKEERKKRRKGHLVAIAKLCISVTFHVLERRFSRIVNTANNWTIIRNSLHLLNIVFRDQMKVLRVSRKDSFRFLKCFEVASAGSITILSLVKEFYFPGILEVFRQISRDYQRFEESIAILSFFFRILLVL